MRHLLFTLAAVVAAGQTGCSLLGIQPPRYKLMEEAKAFRNSAYPPPGPRELAKQPLAPYVVEPGDSLLVQATDLDATIRLPGDQPILPDGTIELGKYGRPVVAGRTVPEVEQEVQRLVNAAEKQSVGISVRLIGRQSKVFYVLGEVNAPGAYQLSGRETVLDGLMVAGGLTRNANEKQIILSRPTQPDGCRIVLPVCYNPIVQLGDTQTNYQLQPGDRVYVPSSGFLDGLLPGRSKGECGACAKGHVPCPTGACGPAVPDAGVRVAPGTAVAPGVVTLPASNVP
jgi:protein involved in polysaccharide export with SLBB domain